jgi:protein-S-isoprenylcysteine O-methyltransferase Ste14
MARILVPAIFVLFNKALSRSFASRTPPLVPLTDRLSIWLVSVGMVLVFLILILFMIQVEISRPKNTIQLKALGTATLCLRSRFLIGTALVPFSHQPAIPPSNR